MILANDAVWLDSVILQRGSDIDRETVLEYLKMFIAEQKNEVIRQEGNNRHSETFPQLAEH